MTPRLAYRPDIDGLRAIAVLAVVFYHAGVGFSGGYVGVDVFFVISGFLITSLIVRDIRAGTFSMLDFWGRRARRIAPAMVAMVAATFAAGWFILLPEDLKEVGQSVVAQATLLANVYFYRESGYFAAPSELKPLLHTWSLAVEEQFYLLVPPLLVVLHRVRRPPFVAVFLLVLTASLLWSEYVVQHRPDAAFYLLPSRAWELGLGSGLALLQSRLVFRRGVAEVLGWGGLVSILYSVFVFDQHTVFPGMSALLPCLGTAAVIAGNMTRDTSGARLLSLRPVVFVGLASYSLYLWHWPILAYSNYLNVGDRTVFHRTALVGLSFLVAVASWKWVEMPIRRKQVFASRRAIFRFTAASLLGLVVAGAVVHVNSGFRERFTEEVLRYADAGRDTNPRRGETFNVPFSQLANHQFPRIGDGDDTRSPWLMVIGDSHANALMPLLEELARAYRVPAVAATRQATIPLLGAYADGQSAEKQRFQELVGQAVLGNDALRHVILAGRWMAYDNKVMNALLLAGTVDFFRSRGIYIWIVNQVPEPLTEVPRALALAALHGKPTPAVGIDYQAFQSSRAQVDRLFGKLPSGSVTIIDPLEWFFPDRGVSRVELGGRALYSDDDHLSVYGALQLRPLLEPVFARIVEEFGSSDETDPTESR